MRRFFGGRFLVGRFVYCEGGSTFITPQCDKDFAIVLRKRIARNFSGMTYPGTEGVNNAKNHNN